MERKTSLYSTYVPLRRVPIEGIVYNVKLAVDPVWFTLATRIGQEMEPKISGCALPRKHAVTVVTYVFAIPYDLRLTIPFPIREVVQCKVVCGIGARHVWRAEAGSERGQVRGCRGKGGCTRDAVAVGVSAVVSKRR